MNGIKEIFGRKDDIEKEKQNKALENKPSEVAEYEEVLKKLNAELYDEIELFKTWKEKELLNIISIFFEEKYKFMRSMSANFRDERASLHM